MPVDIKVSVIIPCRHKHEDLFKVVYALCNQSEKPSEIIIIDSSDDCEKFPLIMDNICKSNAIKLIYKSRNFAFPGDARNIGLQFANENLIAFIDVQTIPNENWLEHSLEILKGQNVDGVFGTTFFIAQTSFEKLFRDGFYGVLPLRTLPGSIFKREVFKKAGHFIDWARAGEDTDWMLRLEVLKVPIAAPVEVLLEYNGLVGANLKQLILKWHRNYSAARELPHFFSQKFIFLLIIYPLLVLIACNWNYLIADWRVDSPLYIGHVTKMVVFIPCLIYITLRGLLFPLQRGVQISQILPVRFMGIVLICLIADLIKIFVLSFPITKKNDL